ncbi:uncharacterized protein UTRI_01180_B [Ustilago trichophora]|uniref:Uncharacterized protein n=1 Tax=Ustilago trichophora TaxID=86804 RepID=A0A5C3DU05_9BASI|nr:uncharacterized protein UTRI_01180_B [Ustilago trichophora]
MPRPRTPKPHGGSREGSGEDSDATVDPALSIQTRRTRKRPAHLAREGSEDQSGSQPASRPHVDIEHASTSVTDREVAQGNGQAIRQRNAERRATSNAAHSTHLANSSAFETPNQARDRLALLQFNPSNSGNTTHSPRGALPHRPVRSTRPSLSADQPAQNGLWRSTSLTTLSHQPTSSRRADSTALESPRDNTDAVMTPVRTSSQQADQETLLGAARPLTQPSQNASSQPQTPSTLMQNVPMARTTSNMSPPRPTRSLPRRQASARTQSRPLLSSSNSASSSYALRSRSTSSSNILAPSNSTANILASSQNNRQNLVTGCVPLGGGFDPNYNPPSGMSTPRTPLAEIPLWLADMRSESRRSSTSSTSFMDREDFLSASRSASSRHARTVSTSSSGPSSPGATRNGSTSPVVPFRRSLRGRRPRQSDENARISPSPSYFGEYDALPSPSSASARSEMIPVDEAFDPNASLSSSMIHLGTSSPSTPSVHLQTSSPAMSTRSRTLNRAGSVRNRRMTNPLNTPVSMEATGLLFRATGLQNQESHSAFHQARPAVQQGRVRNGDEQRSASLLERRAATAAATIVPAGSHAVTRSSSRPSSRTSSPARGTRASRRRSTAVEGQVNSAMETSALGPRPATLPPLQIPGARLTRDVGLMMLDVPASASIIPEHPSEELVAMADNGQHPAQIEPVSPSAFSEMTSLTQGSTASDSMHSAGGMPATPSSSTSNLDPFASSTHIEAGTSTQIRRTRGTAEAEADTTLGLDIAADTSTNRVLRQTTSQRKPPHANGADDGLGIQLRPRPQ